MSDLATQLRHELIELTAAAQRAAHTAMLLNHPQAEALRLVAAFTKRLVEEDGSKSSPKH
jgi:hypothetical protein